MLRATTAVFHLEREPEGHWIEAQNQLYHTTLPGQCGMTHTVVVERAQTCSFQSVWSVLAYSQPKSVWRQYGAESDSRSAEHSPEALTVSVETTLK